MNKKNSKRVLILLTLLLTIWFVFNTNYFINASVLLDRVVALVNKEVITWSELYQMMEQELSDKTGTMTEEEKKEFYKNKEGVYLERLIDIKLQIQEAKRSGIEVSQKEISEAIENIKNKYLLTDDDLKESLKNEGITLDEYKDKLREKIMISKIINQQVRSKIIVSDKEVEDYIKKNSKNIVAGESYKLRQIFFKMPEDKNKKVIIEEKASSIIERLKDGEDFATLAREYSEDPSSTSGGDLGFIQKESMAKEFINILSNMEVGDFSMPFWTDKGLHIIKLEEKRLPQSMKDVKNEIRKKLREKKFLKRYETWIKDLRDKAYIVILL